MDFWYAADDGTETNGPNPNAKEDKQLENHKSLSNLQYQLFFSSRHNRKCKAETSFESYEAGERIVVIERRNKAEGHLVRDLETQLCEGQSKREILDFFLT